MEEAYKQRVREEFTELMIKVVKLETFLRSPAGEDLSEMDKILLDNQYGAMNWYSSTLMQRMKRF